jgi:Domain of unknown function (DUF4145)
MEQLIRDLNWNLLERYDILKKKELISLYKILNVDSSMSLAKFRKIFESLIHFLYKSYVSSNKSHFSKMINELSEKKIFPETVKAYLNTIRIIGNIAVHQDSAVSIEDIKVLTPMFVYTAKWLVGLCLEKILKDRKKK